MNKILAIPASNSRNGINRRLIGHAARVLEAGLIGDVEVELLDLNDYEMPIFSMERLETGGIPEPAQRFFDTIGSADAVVISFAEHNGSYAVAWKNVYDWASRIDMQVFQTKKVALFATSPGGRGGRGVLEHAATVAPFFGADVVGTLPIPSFNENCDPETGEITEPELAAQFESVLRALA